MAGRITQAPIEVLIKPYERKPRITQAPIEVLIKPYERKPRTTQAIVEVLLKELPFVQVNSLTLASTLEDITPSGGVVSLTLDTLTLIANTEDINIAIELLLILNELTLAGSLENLTIDMGTIGRIYGPALQ
jgi:hypothetical protein